MLTFSFSSLLYLPFPKNEAVVSLSEAPPGEEPDFTILCCLTPPDVFISPPLNYTPTLSLPGPCYHMVLCNSLEVAIPFSDYNFLFRHLSSFLSLNLLQILLLPTPLIGQHMGSKITADGDCSHEIKRRLLLGRKVMKYARQHIKKQRHYFTKKGPSSQGYGFSSGHVWMQELNYKES